MQIPPSKDIWDKLGAIAGLTTSILVPLAVAFVGSTYSSAMKDSENRLKYVELAISLLRAEPTEQTIALRTWAVAVINHQAIVPLTSEAQAQLLQQRIVIYDTSYVGSPPLPTNTPSSKTSLPPVKSNSVK